MANNRMYLVCPCGERFRLAKSYADGWFTGQLEDLDAWFGQHRNCEPRVWGGTMMALEYEQTEELPGMTRRPALTDDEMFFGVTRRHLPEP